VVTVQHLRHTARLLDELAGLADVRAFPAVALPELAALIGCDGLSYNEIGPDAVRMAGYPEGWLDPRTAGTFARLAHQHPLVRYYRRTRDPHPAALSAHCGRREFHATELYAEYYAARSVEHQLAVTLAEPGPSVVGLAFSRAAGDFGPAEREVLDVLRQPLRTALLRCRARGLAARALTGPGPELLGQLTEREVRVLELVAEGATNAAIARTLRISPRTVAKHLEHAYRKLRVSNRAAAASRLGASRP
jgi:DNA-binding CsgD family transcriptional regulator